jgi:hypothetical protein
MNPLVIGIIVIAVFVVFFLVSNNRNQPTTTLMPMRLPTTQSKTVRQLLEEKCPLSESGIRNGVVYINPLNGATREEYLLSGCKAAGTCDTTNIDPISKTILDNLPYDSYHKRGCACGCWALGEYEWDNTIKKWIKSKTVRQALEERCPLSGSVIPNREDYLFSGCKKEGTCDTAYVDPISKNIFDNIPNRANCGSLEVGNYRWDQTNKRWIKTVRQALEDLCPIKWEQRGADGVIKIMADINRDDYLFSGCKEAGTCDTTTYDPISQNIINNIPSKTGCGSLELGNYSWDNTNKKWIPK